MEVDPGVSSREECCHFRKEASTGRNVVFLAHLSWPFFFTAVPRAHEKRMETAMDEVLEVLYTRCCGLDVHKKTVVASVIITPPQGRVQRHLHTFSTTTAGLLALLDWLGAFQVSHVAIESTGIYWRPIFNLLEGECEVILVNAQHMKAVPGRKTDVKESEWLASRLAPGAPASQLYPS